MRRGRFLGVILGGLALLAQFLLAAAAISAQAADGAGVPTCEAGSHHAPPAPGGFPPHHHHCPLCIAAAAGCPVLPARYSSLAPPYREARPVFWIAAAGVRFLFGYERHRPPRGPPPLI